MVQSFFTALLDFTLPKKRPRGPVIGHVLLYGHARNGAADRIWERMKEELKKEEWKQTASALLSSLV